MLKNQHTTVAVCIVILFGFILFYIGTDGFQAYTETARVNQLIEETPQFPNVMLEDSKGREYSFSKFDNQYVLITFFYTSCTTVCIDLEWNMAQVYDAIPSKYIGKNITFLSISFDPTRDTPDVLSQYGENFGSDGEKWRMARITNQDELDSLLKKFGVIVIPDDYGNFTHNSAFYLVNKNGRLIDVLDYTNVEESAKTIVNILERETGV